MLLFLSSICNEFNPNNYVLKSYITGQEITVSDDFMISRGQYAFIPKEGYNKLCVKDRSEFVEIIPSSKLSKSSSVSSLSTHSIESDSKIHKRNPGPFRDGLLSRDNHCVITRNYSDVEASHILAHSWWNYHASRRYSLPKDIQCVVSRLMNGIDDISNGVLLRRDLSDAFDKGHISFYFEHGNYFVAAIGIAYEQYDGMKLDHNTRQRGDGSIWWSDINRPNLKLIAFHLQNSVFRHMHAQGGVHDDDSDHEEPMHCKYSG